MRVQSFSSFSLEELTKSINAFCSSNNVTNIQYQTVQVLDGRYSNRDIYKTKYTALITYIDEMEVI